uniref:Pescadillo homolog (Trinotate prediction) n=1 Tax=Henneguya salminicola TaxID=69463 RepID=A0A6G3MFD9_HENSL
MHDPLINFFRQELIHKNKMKKAVNVKNDTLYCELLKNKPKLNLEHIIKERYPSFDDVSKDLDDSLSLIFTLARMPTMKNISVQIVEECQRLSNEFLHYVITSKSLTKVFISLKGYYFQANIGGENVTWIIPHTLVPNIPTDIDYKIIKSFSEFYVTLLGFVNCHLYNSIYMIYPPKILGGILKHKKDTISNNDLCRQLLCSLNIPLMRNNILPKSPQIDTFSEHNQCDGITKISKISSLFEAKVFYLSREVSKEPFVFAIKLNYTWSIKGVAGELYLGKMILVMNFFLKKMIS